MTQAITIREIPYRAKTIKVRNDGTCRFSGIDFVGRDESGDIQESLSILKAMTMIDTLLSLRIINNLRRNSDSQNELSTQT